MKLSKISLNEGKAISIAISGAIQFEHYNDFRQAYINEHSARAISLDLTDVTQLDCSAVGMILLLQDFAVSHNIAFTLINSSHKDARKMLAITKVSQYVEHLIEPSPSAVKYRQDRLYQLL